MSNLSHGVLAGVGAATVSEWCGHRVGGEGRGLCGGSGGPGDDSPVARQPEALGTLVRCDSG